MLMLMLMATRRALHVYRHKQKRLHPHTYNHTWVPYHAVPYKVKVVSVFGFHSEFHSLSSVSHSTSSNLATSTACTTLLATPSRTRLNSKTDAPNGLLSLSPTHQLPCMTCHLDRVPRSGHSAPTPRMNGTVASSPSYGF
ncbi:Vacuolar-sorting protein SNF7 [Fusarium oxysporum f. sp. albedinis]|nr:Vacuolar-sorting protein SNF7 [Fusarium oxysporum f. sp. albedinis]